MIRVKFRFAAILFAAALMAGGVARAGGPLLTGGFMGLNIPAQPLSFSTASPAPQRAFAGSLGFRLSPAWRLEGEIAYTGGGSHAENGGESRTRLSLVNLSYDFDIGKSRFRPFLSIGAGLASDGIYQGGPDGLGLAEETGRHAVWQLGGGLNYQISDDLSLSGGYRHIGLLAPSAGASSGGDGHELRMGVTWKLPVRRNRDVPGR